MRTWGKIKKEKKAESMDKTFELFMQGLSYRAIAARLCISKSTVERWINARPISDKDKLNGTAGQRDNAYFRDNERNGTQEERDDQDKGGHEFLEQEDSKDWDNRDTLNAEDNEAFKESLDSIAFPDLQTEDLGTKGQAESKDSGTEKLTNYDFLDEKKTVLETKAKGTMGQTIKNGTVQTKKDNEMQDPKFSRKIQKEMNVPDERDSGTAGQESRKPRLVTNKKGQQFMLYHPEMIEYFGIDDIQPEPHEILNQVKVKTPKPVYRESEKNRVAKVNNELKKWVMFLLKNSKDEPVRISELKAFLETINKYQQSIEYRYLPENYEYAGFIEDFKAKINRLIISANIDELKKCTIVLDSYEEELKEVLFEIG